MTPPASGATSGAAPGATSGAASGDLRVDAFSAHAGVYDRARRALIPCFDRFYAVPAEALTHLGVAPRRALDLGAGTGLLSAMIAQSHAVEDLTLLDRSVPMMAQGAQALAHGRALHLREADMADPAGFAGLAPGFDAIWSALAIHHLDAAGKQALFARVFDLLRPGGVFLNADQALGDTAALEAVYRADWLARVRAAGVPEEDLALALQRMQEDRMDPLADQLAWLRQAGFAASVWFQDYSFNVVAAVRPD